MTRIGSRQSAFTRDRSLHLAVGASHLLVHLGHLGAAAGGDQQLQMGFPACALTLGRIEGLPVPIGRAAMAASCALVRHARRGGVVASLINSPVGARAAKVVKRARTAGFVVAGGKTLHLHPGGAEAAKARETERAHAEHPV